MPTIETVTGPVEADRLGRTLMHEHVFILSPEHAANEGRNGWWDEEQRVEDAVRRLAALHRRGIDAIVDPTVWGLGRDVHRLRRIAERVDLRIVVATGVYIHEELPHHYAYRGPGLLVDVPEPMVEDFVRDIEVGIAGTGIRAGVLKCAIDAPGLTPAVERVARAVAEAHLRTGVPITVHTSAAARSGGVALDLFESVGVDPGDVVVGHAGDSNDLDYLTGLADRGALLGMDRFGLDVFNPERDRIATVAALAARGYADRMVLSHDTACFLDYFGAAHDQVRATVTPNWHYEHISDTVLPALRDAGVTDDQLCLMLVDNPRRYLSGGQA
ncbi:phosphotriesterase family protein [Micromonospora marina]|uniref:phosphotriesterase family protein n=1 Tax=Micromonospora marina TaxID=307120 RepID=UPI003451D2E7